LRKPLRDLHEIDALTAPAKRPLASGISSGSGTAAGGRSAGTAAAVVRVQSKTTHRTGDHVMNTKKLTTAQLIACAFIGIFSGLLAPTLVALVSARAASLLPVVARDARNSPIVAAAGYGSLPRQSNTAR
jgi:hypothetical protein